MANLRSYVMAGADLSAAIERVDREARQRQAEEQPEIPPGAGGIDPTNPGAIGNAPPGATLPGPTQAGQRLRQLTTNLNSQPSAANRIPTRA